MRNERRRHEDRFLFPFVLSEVEALSCFCPVDEKEQPFDRAQGERVRA